MKTTVGIPTDRIIQKRLAAMSCLIILAFLCAIIYIH